MKQLSRTGNGITTRYGTGSSLGAALRARTEVDSRIDAARRDKSATTGFQSFGKSR